MATSRWAAAGVILGALLFVPVFNALAIGVLLAIPPAAGLAWIALLGGGFLAWHYRGEGRRRRRALLRLGLPGAGERGRAALSVGASLALLFALATLIQLTAPALDPDETSRVLEALEGYQETTLGWIALALTAAVAVPIVEEFCFRGYIQHTLSRRLGPAWGIGLTASVFAVAHVGGPHWSILLIPLTLGLLNGVSVRILGSIWPAVAVHALWNLAMISAPTGADEPASPRTLLAVAGVLALAGFLGWRRVLGPPAPGVPVEAP